MKARRTPSSDGDSFIFEYSTNGTHWTPMLTVTKNTDDGAYQTFTLPASLSGTVHVRVRDTDRTPGHKTLDTVYIDHMQISTQ